MLLDDGAAGRCRSGGIHLRCEDGDATLQPYQTALIPAAAPYVQVRSDHNDAPFMFITPPIDTDVLPIRLLAAGVAQDRIDSFLQQFR